MQNFDDLDIEGRNPSHITEEEREKVIQYKKIFQFVNFPPIKGDA